MHHELTINGDFTTEYALKHKVNLHELARSKQTLTINLRNVEKADFVGVNTLVTTYKIMSNLGSQLFLKISKNGDLQQLLHLTKFDKTLNLI
jgi:anti-anti-sigma regulatory factor